ncbi:MBL fold metallo-hydrolase [Nostoc sp. FACHB-892]|uniref:MBL fold metallo-hydrolase n=1 Tax=Nostoc sp. FACHB-892 TaxID=2692843 RepID=UPI0016841339|nr:MBL fold metallo-hydrolase [Nostoc sp. FACHB-892]MBD2730569.1 MBL fold metallo-hydrolase [Nostoc sp. FACHB-892]
MEIQMIGHASIFVETQDCKILMDPVLWSPYLQGIEDVYPKREVIHELLPDFDLLIISHWHSDHFDIRSLAHLPKTVDVLIPQDKVLKNCLIKLGYSQIYTVEDFSEVKIGSTSILATRSENRVPEFGIVFSDLSGVFWNQVDSNVSLDTIRFVKSRYPQIDFLLAPWQPMLETNYQYNKSLSFPYSSYNKCLKNISMIQPKAIAPGANGFKKINGSSWLNKIVFPVTREQFCKDVRMVYPEVGENVFSLEPGDILVFKNNEFRHMKEICQFVNKLEDDRDILDFSPVNIDGNIIDDNPDNYNLDEMREAIEEEVLFNFPKFIQEKKYSLFLEHCHWKVIYQLEIVFPNCSRRWSFDFSEKNISVQAGRNPFANLFTLITASSFYSLLKRFRGWEYVALSGYHRRFQKIYVVTPHGIIQPDEKEIEEPISLRFSNKDIFETVQYQEVEKWKQSNENSAANESKTFMMKVGNTLVRLVKEEKN